MTTQDDVLNLLKDQNRLSPYSKEWLAQHLNKSPDAIAKALQRLLKKKLIEGHGSTTGRWWEAVPSSVSRQSQEPSVASSTSSEVQTKPEAKLQLRLHRLQRNYKYIVKPDLSKLADLKQVDIENNTYYQGTGFKIWTNTILELEGIELWAARTLPVAILEGIALSLANNIANSIAKQYGFTVDLTQPWSPENLMEVELTEHDMAERVKKKGKIPLHWDDELNPDVWMDKSFGLGGLESNQVAYIQKLTDFTNYIVEGRWSAKAQLELNNALRDRIEQVENRHDQYMTKHESLLDAVTAGQKLQNAWMQQQVNQVQVSKARGEGAPSLWGKFKRWLGGK